MLNFEPYNFELQSLIFDSWIMILIGENLKLETVEKFDWNYHLWCKWMSTRHSNLFGHTNRSSFDKRPRRYWTAFRPYCIAWLVCVFGMYNWADSPRNLCKQEDGQCGVLTHLKLIQLIISPIVDFFRIVCLKSSIAW